MAERTRARSSSTVVRAGLLSNLRSPLEELALAVNTKTNCRTVPAQRQQQRRLSEAEIDRLALEYQGGATIRELAQEFGIHKGTVSGHLSRRGVERRGPIGPTAEQVEQAVAMYWHGDSLSTIGQHLGFDAQTINLALRRAGVEIRSRRGWPS